MKTEQLQAIWAEIEEVARAADARSRAAMIEEKLAELWMARYDAEDAALTDGSKDRAFSRIAEKMRERQAEGFDTYSNGKAPGGLSSALKVLLHPRRDRRTRIAWMGLAASLLLLGLIWYSLDLPGAPGFKTWMAGGRGMKSNQVQPIPELPESPRIVPENPAPETPNPKSDSPGLGAPPKTSPNNTVTPNIPKTQTPKPSKSEGMLAQRIEVGKFTSVMGEPTVSYLGEKKGFTALPNKPITTAMRIETGDADKCELRFADGSTIALDFNTKVILPPFKDTVGRILRPSDVRVESGRITAQVAHLASDARFAVHTPVATAEVRGTTFTLSLERLSLSSKVKAVLQVKEGSVAFYNEHGRVQVPGMAESAATADSAPTEPKRYTVYILVSTQLTHERYMSLTAAKASVLDRPQILALDQKLLPFGFGDWKGSLLVVAVRQGSSALKAGLRPGDRIVSIDGARSSDVYSLLRKLLKSKGTSYRLLIRRAEREFEVKIAATSAQTGWLAHPPKPGDPVYEASWPALDGRAKDAEAALERLLVRTPASAPAHNNLGVLFDQDERYRMALRHYREAVKLEPRVLRYRDNLAQCLFRIGNFSRSLEERNAIAQLAPALSDNLIKLADTYYSLGRQADASRILDSVLSRDPENAEAWSVKSQHLIRSHRYEEAMACANRAAKLDPWNPLMLHAAGSACRAAGKDKEAEIAFRRAIELAPGFKESYGNLGVMLTELRRYDEAEQMIRRALDLEPDDASLFNALGSVMRARSRYEEAERAFRRAIELDREDRPAALNNLGAMLSDLGRLEEAEKLLRQSIARYPASAATTASLGALLLKTKRISEGLSLLQLAIELNPRYAGAFDTLGLFLWRNNRLEEAERYLRRALELEPSMTSAYNNLGLVFQYANRPGEAERMYRRAIEIDPNHAHAHLNLGYLFAGLGFKLTGARRDEEAVVEIRRGIELMKGVWDDREDHGNAYLNLGTALVRLGRLKEAEASYRNAIAIRPAESHAYHALGSVLARMGRYEESEKEFQRSFELDTKCVHAYTQLFNLYRPLERFAEAEIAMRKAIALDPKSQIAHHNLAYAVERLGRWEEAEPIWRHAIDLDSKNVNTIRLFARGLSNRGAKLDEALEWAKRAVALAMTDLPARRDLGWVHYKRGELQTAANLLKEAIALSGDSHERAIAWSDLGEVYEKLMQAESAKDAYRRALTLQPGQRRAIEALKRLGGTALDQYAE